MTSTARIARDAWPGKDQPKVTGSSVYTRDPEDMPSAAFDGSDATAWIASGRDRHPALTIRWHRARLVRTITVSVPRGANSLDQVQVTDPAGVVGGGFIGRTATIELPRTVRTDQLTLTFSPPALPLQIAEVHIPGVRSLTASASAPVRLRCGTGPTVFMNGKLVRTRAAGTAADLRYGRPMTFTGCSTATVRTGQNAVVEPASDPTGWDVQSVLIGAPARSPGAAAGGGPAAPVRTLTWTASRRVLQVAAGQPAYLEVAQNYNAGWQATVKGKTLRPVRLDGWEQAWLLPAGTRGLVTLTYRPEAMYRYALVGGLGLLAVILAIALMPRRRRPAGLPAMVLAERTPADPAGRTRATGEGHGTGPGGGTGRSRAAGLPRLAARIAGLVVLGGAGLWLGGYPGALLLPIATVIFALAGVQAERDDGRRSAGAVVGRVLYCRWVPAGLVPAAAAGAAAGSLAFEGSGLATALTDSGPQLLCLLVVARLAAGLVARTEAGIPDNELTDWPENN
jgi:arabinofuranan 3-O-arabinosyltransferase